MSEHEIDPFIEEIAVELRRPVRFDSTFESRVMAELETSAASLPMKRTASTSWLLRPHTFYVSPLAGLAVAAGLVAIITMSVVRTLPSNQIARADTQDTSVAPTPTDLIPVVNPAAPVPVSAPFTYIDRNAKSVAVVGSFNGWEPLPLTQSSDSVWSGSAMILPGRYEYQLVVDGKLIADPGAQQTAASEFGVANSVMIVSPVPR